MRTYFKQVGVIILGATFIVLLVACQSGSGTQGPGGESSSDVAALAGTTWRLESLNENPPVEGSNVTLSFDEETIEGSTGCNGFSGQYRLADGRVMEVVDMNSTLMACTSPVGLMEQEMQLQALLSGASGVTLEGDRLTVQDEATGLTAVFVREG